MSPADWEAKTNEKRFWCRGDVFIKSSLRPDDWGRFHSNGYLHQPRLGRERALNEAANLRFLASSSIPVPRVLCEYEDNGAFVIVMTRADGVPMDELCADCKQVARANVAIFAERLHSLKSSRPGGASGLVCPPHQVMERWSSQDCHWRLRDADDDAPEYVFCHGDLREGNVFIDPHTLEVSCLIVWALLFHHNQTVLNSVTLATGFLLQAVYFSAWFVPNETRLWACGTTSVCT
jgi:hypothetical protein